MNTDTRILSQVFISFGVEKNNNITNSAALAYAYRCSNLLFQSKRWRVTMTKIKRLIGCVVFLHMFNIQCFAANTSESDSPNAKDTIVKRHTWKELRDLHVVKQKEDRSCGAAALTTLISHYFGEETTEKEILDILQVRIDKATDEEKARKKKNGFSLLDLKYAAKQKGYDAAGFKLTFEQLKQLKAPVIVYVEPFGYHHFAVLRGIAGNRVFLADPSRGNLHLSTGQFKDEYGGVVFALGKDGEENILNYPLALSRPDDYARASLDRLVHGANSLGNYATNLTIRARLR
jgi:predicted double-glycine peptidase